MDYVYTYFETLADGSVEREIDRNTAGPLVVASSFGGRVNRAK